ncbi:baseplate J/gp47 family protein [Aurantimonas sp. MSK8Z-1]|uniref:baseplate assembly protein n=1 Tax=Mangrovibrevibacter kandeliae TaxID=2968473 RepID=UPI002117EB25|nr:baseplate J/gp47 family protein [Aurantimonas sp. MSK8Z-1]MCW4114740.1 baseplate J/gp47 family protein [Aurantimonas sp. MSK8Z-1]
MSRFVNADLAALGDVPAVEAIEFEAIRTNRLELLMAALTAHGIGFDVDTLESDPAVVVAAEGGGYSETLIRQRINEAVRSLSLATGRGGNLDHIAATYYGIARQSETVDGVAIVEDDERFRARIALAPEAFSTAGPLGAYVFHALELDGRPDLADAWAYSEEDGATYTAGLHAGSTAYATATPVLAPEVLVVVLPTVAYGSSDQALLDRAFAAVTARDVRPLGDKVTVEPAEVVDYAVEMRVTYARGADPAPLIAAARARIATYVAARRKIGLKAEILGIGGGAYVSGIEAVTLTAPAADVGGGPKQAPNCTGISITAVQSDGSWT